MNYSYRKLLWPALLLAGMAAAIPACNKTAAPNSPAGTAPAIVSDKVVNQGGLGVCGADNALGVDLQVACVQQSGQERRWTLKIVNNGSGALDLRTAGLALRLWFYESRLRCVVVAGNNGDVYGSGGSRIGPVRLVDNLCSSDVSLTPFDETSAHRANQYGTLNLSYLSGTAVIPAGGWVQGLVVVATAGGNCNPAGNWDNFADDYSGLPNGQSSSNGSPNGPYYQDHHFALYARGVLVQEVLPGEALDPESGLPPRSGTCTPTPTFTATATATNTPTSTPTAILPGPCGNYPSNFYLPVELMGQQESMWCWAASSQMAIAFVGNINAPQCFSASTIESSGGTDCCAINLCPSPDTLPCDHGGMPEPVLDYYKFSYTEVNGINSITYSELMNQFYCLKKPVVFIWWWHGGGGHVMVAKGFQIIGGTQYVWVNNPDPECQGEVDFDTFDQFNGGTGYDHDLGEVDYDITKI